MRPIIIPGKTKENDCINIRKIIPILVKPNILTTPININIIYYFYLPF